MTGQTLRQSDAKGIFQHHLSCNFRLYTPYTMTGQALRQRHAIGAFVHRLA